MSPKAWVAVARLIVQHDPSEAGLRCAISILYYAMFHSASKNAADLLIDTVESLLDERAWNQAYRGLDHGRMKEACESSVMKQFPAEIREFAELFVEMQRERHKADYNPSAHFEKLRVLSDINRVEKAIQGFESASEKDRRAFAALVLFKPRTP